VRGVDQAMHRRVDRGGRSTPAVQAVVERGNHLVLPLQPRVDIDQGAQPVEAKHGEAGLGQRPEVTARALDPHELGLLMGHRVSNGTFG
jgi:hypothetical protein